MIAGYCFFISKASFSSSCWPHSTASNIWGCQPANTLRSPDRGEWRSTSIFSEVYLCPYPKRVNMYTERVIWNGYGSVDGQQFLWDGWSSRCSVGLKNNDVWLRCEICHSVGSYKAVLSIIWSMLSIAPVKEQLLIFFFRRTNVVGKSET